MMADTVKKSRIVSDEEENLEEALLEEFNTRLKNCMSEEKAPTTPRAEIESEEEAEEDALYENVSCHSTPKTGSATHDFLKNEREHYDLPPSENLLEDDLHNIYETLPHEKTDPYVEMAEPLHLDLRPKIEIQPGDAVAEAKSPEDAAKSAKDRMLLASEDAGTLLFTQTVTSPMLTPSEENIDFLQGFQGGSTSSEEEPPEAIYENLKEPRQVENIYENLGDLGEQEHIYQDIEECTAPKGEAVYESVTVENSLYDNVEGEVDALAEEVEDLGGALVDSGVVGVQVEDETHYEPVGGSEGDEDMPTLEDVSADSVQENYSEFVQHSRSESNYCEKYSEVVSKSVEVVSREKDTESVPAEIVKQLKSQFSKSGGAEVVSITKKEEGRSAGIMQQINKFEKSDGGDDSTVTETYSETTTIQSDAPEEKSLKKKKIKKSRKEEKENISVTDFDVVVNEEQYVYNVNVKNLCRSFGDLTKIAEDRQYDRRFKSSGKSSFSKFDALQKKNVLHIRSSDSTKAQDKFSGAQSVDTANCKSCSKQVFQMEQIKAEKAVWHKNCFRCIECSKQLNVETYTSHDGNLYCKPHFKSLFAPKVVEEESPQKPRKPELIIRENQPLELPPDVVRASDKPDLGLEDLQSLNVKERFQVFEQFQTESQECDREPAPVNVKKSSSILSKLARFQAKGMDVGVTDDVLNGIPIEESSSEEEEEVEEEVPEGEDATLYRAKRAQKEKPFHFTNLSEVKNKWEQGEQNSRDERREERKQEIQSIRNKLFLGKQGKMKEAYQQAIIQSESCTNVTKSEKIESCDTKSLKERFEKGQMSTEKEQKNDEDDTEVFHSEISKKSRSLFLELDANASKPPLISQAKPQKLEVQKAREAYLAKSPSQDTVRSSDVIEDVLEVKTADIQQRFKFFETYKEPQKEKKRFRITPPRDPAQVKSETPERELYHDPEVVRSDEVVDDSVIAKTSHTASKMLSKFRQMEENLSREPEQMGPKPLKSFTPPPEPARPESDSEEGSESEEESEDGEDQTDNQKLPEDLVEAQKAARAKQLRAKFEKWEAQEIKREQSQTVNIVEEYGDESQVESTKSLRARFESMRETGSESSRTPRVKVNRFVEIPSITEACESCDGKVYPLEKISVHGQIYHKNCFKCKECSCVLRMDTYSYNQGLLYCTPHFKRLFISKGNYDTAFGLDQHKEKWNINATMA